MFIIFFYINHHHITVTCVPLFITTILTSISMYVFFFNCLVNFYLFIYTIKYYVRLCPLLFYFKCYFMFFFQIYLGMYYWVCMCMYIVCVNEVVHSKNFILNFIIVTVLFFSILLAIIS